MVCTVGTACLWRFLGNGFMTSSFGRRDVLAAATAGAVAVTSPFASFADWQGEPTRNLILYGGQILKLQADIESGKLDGLKKKLGKFTLFASACDRLGIGKGLPAVASDFIEAVELEKVDDAKTAYAKLIEGSNIRKMLDTPPAKKSR